ncbi:MAG: MFS domain-containing histidine kinase [Candidatus Levybacteria bacterium]|nr:MFS domain-containing histidine kinase [Candidatus Levybacteria bacterium]
MSYTRAVRKFYQVFIQPRSKNIDDARMEFILTILLIGLVVLTGIAFFINILGPILYPTSKTNGSPFVTGFIFAFICLLLLLARIGKDKISASITIGILLLAGIYGNYYWGSDLGIVLLLYALIIIMTGILSGTRYAFMVTVVCGFAIIFFTYLQLAHVYYPNTMWKKQEIGLTDSIVNTIILCIIAIISWLSNREIQKTLIRARKSEAALLRQKNLLEETVEKRTHELRVSQAEKLAQLYRFAEFGKMASGLFHDLSNPLMLVSLNLDRLHRQSKNTNQKKISDTKILLGRALSGTHKLENFIQAARKQVQSQDIIKLFSLQAEIDQVMQMLEYKAKKTHVMVIGNIPKNVLFYGSPVKFNQLVTNLVSNAIDAYSTSQKKEKKVEISLVKIKNKAFLQIQDWGSGIEKKDIGHIFEPLFTTKSPEKGMGMGLSICRDVVEKDLNGKFVVESKVGIGTTFLVEFPIRKKQNAPQ